MTTYCDVNTCEDCPRYGDDCDGDKRVEHTDTISRADAIEAVLTYFIPRSHTGERGEHEEDFVRTIFKSLPSADADPTVIRSKTLLPTKDFKEWAKRVREENPNVIVIPCDAEVVSADAVHIHNDGTLVVKVPNAQKVGRVLVMDTESHIGGGLFYPESADAEHGFRGGKIPPKEMLDGAVLIPQRQWLDMERELAELKEKLESADVVQGEWIWRTDIPIGDGRTSAGYICSNCGKDYWHGNVFDYCPSCGARMYKGGAEK